MSDSVVLARGCSTIEEALPGDCENHRMTSGEEKFCYCNQWLCNSSPSLTSSLWLLPCWLEVAARTVALLISFLDKLSLSSVKVLTHLLTQPTSSNTL